MFDIGMSEMVLLAIIGLIVIGPKQLPEVAAKAARLLNEFKRMTSDFTGEFTKTRDSATDFLTQTRNEINSALEDKFSDQPNLSGLDQAKADPIYTGEHHDDHTGHHHDMHGDDGDEHAHDAGAKKEEQMSFAIDDRKDPKENG